MNAYNNTKYVPRWVSIAVLAAVVAFGMIGLLTHKAFAQATGELRLTGTGVPINLSATPGSVASTDISIRNSGTQTETLKVGLEKFNQDANGNPTLSNRGSADTYFDWVTLSPSNLTLAPNEQKTVRMTINIPSQAAFDYYYAVTFSRANSATGSSANLNGSLATLVLLNVNVPGAKRELTVTDFSASQGIYQFLPATFNVKIKNTGNIFAIPHGDVTVDQGNSELARFAVNANNGYVLPGATRTFTVQWNDGFPRNVPKTNGGETVLDKNGQPETNLDVNWGNVNKFRIGQYTADLEMVYDNGTRDVLVEKSTTFVVFPWVILLVVLIIVGLLIWAVVNDIIKFEHFLFRRGGKKGKAGSASARTQLPRFKAPAAAVKKPAAKRKPAAKKPAAKKTATRKRK